MNDDRPKNARRPTIRAIAEAAGVSRGTVDRALNNRGDVNAEVAARIRELARRLGYVPNKAAKALRFNYAPRTIGVVLPRTSSGFFDQIESGVEQAQAELAGMGIHPSVLRFDPRSEAELVDMLARLAAGRVDGAILTGPDTAAVREAVSRLIVGGIPVITINSDISVSGKLCFVGQDLRRSGVVAAEIMAKIVPGPGRVIAVTGNLEFQAHRDRITGFREGISQWAPEVTVDVREGFDAYDRTHDCVRAAIAEADRAGEPIVGLYMATGSIEAALEVVRGYEANRVSEARRSREASEGREADARAATGRVRVITNDALPVVHEGLARREIDFSILQDPRHQGSVPVRMLADFLLSGARPEPWYRSPILIIGASNAEVASTEETPPYEFERPSSPESLQ